MRCFTTAVFVQRSPASARLYEAPVSQGIQALVKNRLLGHTSFLPPATPHVEAILKIIRFNLIAVICLAEQQAEQHKVLPYLTRNKQHSLPWIGESQSRAKSMKA